MGSCQDNLNEKKKNEITGEMNKNSFMDLGMKVVIQFSLSKLNTE